MAFASWGLSGSATSGLGLDSHTLGRATAGHPPQRVLVVALAHYFEIIAPAEEHDVDGRLRLDERLSWRRRTGGRCRLGD